ncbi:MAG: ATP-binding protein [Endomicrobium sp.]|jgi:hypothetical protein|nr:ATP-binding protein [Endomicrobium sp.]
MNPFNKDCQLGYVYEILPQFALINFPSAKKMDAMRLQNSVGGEAAGSAAGVGDFVIIESSSRGFLARIIELKLHDNLNKSIANANQDYEVLGKAEILLSFNSDKPEKAVKTAFAYPSIGSKVYACQNEQIQKYVENFGAKSAGEVYADLGTIISSDVQCRVSLNALLKRHCAVVGTTGGGKSWTVSKLIEEISSKTKTKIILFDATGEYATLGAQTVELGRNAYLPYEKLSISDLFILLRPGGQSQRSILLEAIRSLKIVRLDAKTGAYKKAYMQRKEYNELYKRHVKEIEDNTCNFNINYLVAQIKEECVLYFPEGWGAADIKMYDQQASLVNRIVNLINTDLFNRLFGFKNIMSECVSVMDVMEQFLLKPANPQEPKENILRINLENVSSLFNAKEIVANALGSYFLEKGRRREFIKSPVILVIDEAHQFLNKDVKDEFSETLPLNAFDLIAKECRKYGLFLCLATQMPRDISTGTLSQMGSFIVHRLINEADKRIIENASAQAGKNALDFLPSLGEGEVLLIGADFQMPLLIKINVPKTPPNSQTPDLTA